MIIYERQGECKPDECGAACCRNLFNPTDETERLLEPVDGICKYLDQETNRCILHDTNKPPLCMAFPYENNPLHHNFLKVKDVCGFWFKEETLELKDG